MLNVSLSYMEKVDWHGGEGGCILRRCTGSWFGPMEGEGVVSRERGLHMAKLNRQRRGVAPWEGGQAAVEVDWWRYGGEREG